MWVLYALLSAVFAALVSILAKLGLKGVNSNLATAIRTFVVLLLAWGIVFFTGKHKEIVSLTNKNWQFLILSGLATGASWLFYYKALQMGEVSKVAPIDKLSVVFTIIMAFLFLGEQADAKSLIGGLLIAAGTLVLVL
jgi:transporter family protein